MTPGTHSATKSAASPASSSHVPLYDFQVFSRLGADYPWAFDKVEQLRIHSHVIGESEHGIGSPPDHYPCIVKPRRNPRGLASGYCYRAGVGDVGAGNLWQRRYTGEHYSVDVAVLNGRVAGPAYYARGIENHLTPGRFLCWQVSPQWKPPYMETHLAPFLALLGAYRGIVNFEFREVSGTDTRLRLIELHLRPSVEFFPIYGEAGRPVHL